MSDIIDESEPSAPESADDPGLATTTDGGEASEAPRAEAGEETVRESRGTEAAAAFTSGLQSPGEPHYSGAESPLARDLIPPPLPDPTDGDIPDRSHRPSPPIERVVRPMEPAAAPPLEASRSLEEAPPQRMRRLPYYAAQPEEPKRSRQWPMALLAVASGLLGALLVLGGLAIGGVFDEEEPAPPATSAAPIAVTTPPETVIIREVIAPEGSENIATAVGEKVVPSIVTVEVGTGDATSDFAAFGSGSGVVFSADGLILTNHHVIEGAQTSRVIFQDGRIYEADIMGSDELTDLAVLRIDGTGLLPIEFGATEGLKIGDRAIAVGNPLGLEGGASLTVGVVSAFDREVDTGDATPLFGMLQTDAPITNGSSGGALVDAEGRLIGITTAIGVSESGAEGIGFAIPVEVVQRIVGQIIADGEVAHAFLGVQLRTNFAIQPDGAALPAGAIVVGFAEGPSAARDAGLEVDDVILTWDGNNVRTINDLINGIRSASVGDAITLVVDRDGDTRTFTAVLGERPEGV